MGKTARKGSCRVMVAFVAILIPRFKGRDIVVLPPTSEVPQSCLAGTTRIEIAQLEQGSSRVTFFCGRFSLSTGVHPGDNSEFL